MSKLSNFVKYNNWEKLEENIQSVTSQNYSTLVVLSVIHHCKESFDILVNLPNAREWINNLRTRHGFYKIFENYQQAPNVANKYYVDKIFPLLAFLSTSHIDIYLSNEYLFEKLFTKAVKNEKTIKHLFEFLCAYSDYNNVIMVLNYLKNNQQKYPFFTTEWIKSNILKYCLLFDNLEVLKKLDELGYVGSHVTINGFQVSTYILSLMNLSTRSTYNNKNSGKKEAKSFDCFKYLVNKKIDCDQNLLHSVFINEYDYLNSNVCKFEIDWDFNFDKVNQYYGDDNDYYNNNFNSPLTNETLNLAFIEDDDNPDDVEDDEIIDEHFNSYIWEKIVYLIHNLIDYSNTNPDAKKILNNIFVGPNFNFIQQLTMYLNEMISNASTSSSNYRRSRWLRKRRTRDLKSINQTLEIIKYISDNKISNSNPFEFLKFKKHLNIKGALKDITLFLAKIYPITENYKTNYINWIYNKTEIKNLEKTIEKSNFTNLLKTIKKSKGSRNTSRKRKSKKKTVVPPIDGPDPNLNPNPDHNIETDSEDNDSEIEIDV